MRGSTLFDNFFNTPAQESRVRVLKGRSKELNDRRNELLLYRYFWYGAYTKLRFEIVMTRLEDEFYISPRTIMNILSASSEQLRSIRNHPPTPEALKKKYPHLNWTTSL